MAKALKVFIVLLLLLGGAAVGLEFMLFQKREELKGRTQKLENNVVQVSKLLTAPRGDQIKGIDKNIDPNSLKMYTAMDQQLSTLTAIAQTRLDELENTYKDLKTTQDNLATTKEQLAQTQKELEESKAEVASLKQRLADKEQELATANQKIAELDQQIAGLKQEKEALNAQVADIQKDRDAKADKVKLYRQILISLGHDPEKDGPGIGQQFKSRVLLVDKDWNFVVIQHGATAGVTQSQNLLVHRGDQLVAKLRVSTVGDTMSVADIIRDTIKMELKEGDDVISSK